MVPIKDENPTLRVPIVTIVIIALNAAAWLLLQGAGSAAQLARSVCELGVIPGEITGRASGRAFELGAGAICRIDEHRQYFSVITSMFMHGGWLHIIGNMWFLWVFGNNVEDSMGRIRFVVFYLLGGIAAAAAQIATDPSSPVPMVGASGAIGGVMGAYVVLYPRVPVHLLVFLGFFVTIVAVPAWVMLGYWVLLQLLGGLPQIGGGKGGVAFWAHLGGFVAGVLLVFLFRNRALVEEHRRVIEEQGYHYGRRGRGSP